MKILSRWDWQEIKEALCVLFWVGIIIWALGIVVWNLMYNHPHPCEMKFGSFGWDDQKRYAVETASLEDCL